MDRKAGVVRGFFIALAVSVGVPFAAALFAFSLQPDFDVRM